jgi:hypothetical protein
MIVIALGVLWWQAAQSRRDQGARQVLRPLTIPLERYQLLARFEAPAYRPTATPLTAYLRHDYAAAIPVLRGAVARQPDSIEPRYYLGICYLLTGDRANGVQELRAVIAAGDSPYLEEARFYLAKGLLGEGDAAGAQRQLEDVLAMHGTLEKQAAALLAQIK